MKLRSKFAALSPLAQLYCIAVPLAVVMILAFGVRIITDSPSYFDAWKTLVGGKLDYFRTPIYPIFVGLIQQIAGECGFICEYDPGSTIFPKSVETDGALTFLVIVIAQYIVYLISIAYLFKMGKRLLRSEKSAFWVCITYILFASIAGWNHWILTESLSISGTIFFAYNALVFLDNPGIKTFLYTVVWALLLIFLRPSFLFVLPALFIVACLLLFRRENRRKALAFFGAALIATAGVLAYMFAFQQTYKTFGLTAVDAINKYYVARTHNELKPEQTDNAALAAFVANNAGMEKDYHEMYCEAAAAVNQYDLGDVQKLVNAANPVFSPSWFKQVFFRFGESANDMMIGLPVADASVYPFSGLGLTIRLIYFLILIDAILFLRDAKHRRLLLPQVFLWLLMAGNMAVVIIGAPDSFDRLCMPILPIFFILVADLIQRIARHVRWVK